MNPGVCPTVRVQLLGPVAVDVDGASLPAGQPRQRGLLAWLALVHPRASAADSIAGALWGEDPPASAHNAIQVYVSALRKLLRPHGLDVARVGDGYALRGDGLIVDVSAFDQAVSQGRAALRTGSTSQAVHLLEEAAGVWASPPLAGLGDLAFLPAARESLAQSRLAALIDLAHAYLRLRRPDDAVRTATELLVDHPYDERAWAALALGHYRAGRQDAALESCRRAREVLLEDLGVDPSDDLGQLERDILNHTLPPADPEPAPTAPGTAEGDPDAGGAAAASNGGVGLPPAPDLIVGRDALLDELLHRLARPGQLVTLTGIGGIGKTTLATATAHHLVSQGRRVGFVTLEHDTHVVPALERVCRALDLDPGDDPATELRDNLDELLDDLVLDNVEQVDGFAAALPQWLPASGRMSLLVTSRLALHAAGEQVIAVPPLAVTPDTAPSMSGDEAAVRRSAALELFLAEAAHVTADSTAGASATGGASDLADAARLCALLDGIPLAIRLAAARTRALTPGQLLARIEATTSLSLHDDDTPGRHASLAAVLDATWAMLPDPARLLLRLLAETDGPTSLEFLEPATDLDDEAFLSALDDLLTSGLVLRDGVHLRLLTPVREYARALPDRRPYTRRMVARAVEFAQDGPADISGPDAPAELARLGTADAALTSAITRAREADAADPAGAASGGGDGLSASAAALVLRLYRSWLLTGRVVEARRWIDLALTLTALDPVTRTRLELLAGTFASYVNDPGTVETLQQALKRADELDLPCDRILVNAWCCLAAHQANHDNVRAALEPTARAEEAADRSGSPALVALARDLRAYVAAYAGDFEQALAASLAGLEDARRSGDEYDIVLMLTQTASNLCQLGRVGAARMLADEAFDRVGTFDAGPALGHVLLIRGMVHAIDGNLAVARSDLTASLRVTVDRYPDPLATADNVYLLAHCAGQAGDDETAARLFGAGEGIYAEQGVRPSQRITVLGDAERDAIRDRLGADLFDLLASAGRAEPLRVVEALTGQP